MFTNLEPFQYVLVSTLFYRRPEGNQGTLTNRFGGEEKGEWGGEREREAGEGVGGAEGNWDLFE